MVIHHNIYHLFLVLRLHTVTNLIHFYTPWRSRYIMLCTRAFYTRLPGADWHQYPHGCLEGFVVCPGDDLFNALFTLWTELAKCVVPSVCEVAFQGYVGASGATVLWGSEASIWKPQRRSSAGNPQTRAWGGQGKRGTPAFFIYQTWATINTREINQQSLNPWDLALQPTRVSSLVLGIRTGEVESLLKEPFGWNISLL